MISNNVIPNIERDDFFMAIVPFNKKRLTMLLVRLCSNIITNKSIDLAYLSLKITMSNLVKQQAPASLMITYTQRSTSSSVEMLPNLPPIGSVIWLHGLGADGHDFVSMVPRLNLPL